MGGVKLPANPISTARGWVLTPAMVLFAFALALRLSVVGVLPRTDQRITVDMVESFGTVELVWMIPQVQPHFPLYYVFLDVWNVFLPIYSAQYVSLVAGGAVPAVAYCWLRSVVADHQAARVAGLLVVAVPLVVQSRWLRMYSLLALVVLLSWWAAWRWLHEEGGVTTYGVLAFVVVGLHPFGVAAVGAQILWLSIEQFHGRWRPWFRPTVAGIGILGGIGVTALLIRVAGRAGDYSIGSGDMHILYSDVPIQRAIALPLTSITGTAIGTGVLVFVLAATAVLSWWACRAKPWRTRRGRLWLCWLVGSLSILAIGHAIRPIIMLKYVTWIAPAVAFAIVDVTPDNWMGRGMVYTIGGLAAVNVLQATLLKLSVAMVAIWDSGVTTPGAL